MPDLEALGDAVTGAVLAGAVEPKTGPGRRRAHARAQLPQLRDATDRPVLRGLRPESACPPDASRLSSTTCSRACSISKARSGGRCRCSPGGRASLTRRYIAGERARFVSPIALFLFSVFLMFAVLNLTGMLGRHRRRARSMLTSALRSASQKADIAKLEKQRAANAAAGAPVTDLDRKIASEKDGSRRSWRKSGKAALRPRRVSMTRRRPGCATWSERRKRTPSWWSTRCRTRPRNSAGC